MKTFPIIADNSLRAFEVDNFFVSPSGIAKFLASLDGVTQLRQHLHHDKSDDIHIEFTWHGLPCVVWEPFGDNSRYWIGPKDGIHATENVAALETVFRQYQPPHYRQWLHHVVSLRFIRRYLQRPQDR